MVNLKGRSLLSLRDYTPEEILYLLNLSAELKAEKKRGTFKKRLQNKNIALIFDKPSTRTRCAFTVAAADEGAHAEFLSRNDIHLGVKESLEDTARVLGRMFDGIQYRGFEKKTVEKLIKYSGVPVWNGLTDDDHPTQSLADLLTIYERYGKFKGVKVAFIGEGSDNVACALLIAASKVGLDITIVSPEQLFPDQSLVNECNGYAAESGAKILVTADVESGLADADVVYTDVWRSMGEEESVEMAERVKLLTPYRVDAAMMARAKKTAIFMHDLPAVKGNEVTEDVFEGPRSVVFDEAENRMHTIKAVMVATICG